MKKPKKILLLGSGGLRIGQAGEFDYSGSQAIKAFKEEGIKVVLINPNIATVQTDKGLADKVYFLPLTLDYATKVIEDEKPDAIALSFGGQTALNLGLELEEKGVLKKHGVRVLGTPVSVIRDTEDRELFVQRLREIKVHTAKSEAVSTVKAGLDAAKKIGYPIMMRSGFALGGLGSGKVADEKELEWRLKEAFTSSPQILIEEYLGGWKEVEYEVVRDSADNCITVCNMENIDAMGIHTGESIVVAPSQTLSNYEYHMLREVAIKTIRHLGIVGECNIQYALNPLNSEYRVIEVNARLSRSSALASKATGYPLAFVAAKLALGYRLTDLQNSVTKKTTACFEPALDYLVLKMPRWDLTKFDPSVGTKSAFNKIGTEMKSVGEVMAIGRSFEEVLQKAMRSLNIGADGFTAQANGNFNIDGYMHEISDPTTRRIFALSEALRANVAIEKLHALSGIDPWFLGKMKHIVDIEKTLRKDLSKETMSLAKKNGFSDKQIATIRKTSEDTVRTFRKKMNIIPVVKQIDTLAGEFPAETNYLYFTYHGSENDVDRGEKQTLVIGSGPYCIGSSVEFDWSCVQALNTLRRDQRATIMVNSNPETVSTDYDMSDRLYFEELTLERLLDIIDFEKPINTVVSTGGQIPNKLALKLHEHGVKILGTSAKDIDRAEDRHVFSALLDKLGVDQPAWAEVTTPKAAAKIAASFGYPVLIRPSYVLSGSAMNVAFDEKSLLKFLKRAADVSEKHPVVLSKFVENAREIEIDGVAKDGKLVIYAITEHVENAGTHSGDATVVLPPQRTYLETVRRAKKIAKDVTKELSITGPFNIQFLAKDNHLQVIECNVRASRSFPFVSKATGYNFIEIAIQCMLGELTETEYRTVDLDYVAVKSPQFSYGRIKGADPMSYVEMASTGEVACFGDTFQTALLDSMRAAGMRIPQKGVLISLGGEENKVKLLPALEKLATLGLKLYATEDTAEFMRHHDIQVDKVYKIITDKDPGVLPLIDSGRVDLIINIPREALARESTDGFVIRRKAVDLNISLITNRQLAEAFCLALNS